MQLRGLSPPVLSNSNTVDLCAQPLSGFFGWANETTSEGGRHVEQRSGGTTSPALLDRLRDVGDHPAWVEFVERYEPMMRRWCRYYGLDDQAADELCLRTWERLWPRMRTFQYDPSRRFRSWLRRFFHSRAMDLLGEARRLRSSHSMLCRAKNRVCSTLGVMTFPWKMASTMTSVNRLDLS